MEWRSKLLWFIGKFVLFLILLALVWPFLAPGYSKLLIWPANKLLALGGIPIELRLEEEGIKSYLLTKGPDLQNSGSKPSPFRMKIFGSYEIILLIALFLATPGLKALKRLGLTAAALGTIFIYHVVDIVLGIRLLYRPSPFYSWAYMLSIFGQLWVPLLIWGLLTFRYWLPKPRTAMVTTTRRKIRPNDPCPCGSGKKYKRCCGKRS